MTARPRPGSSACMTPCPNLAATTDANSRLASDTLRRGAPSRRRARLAHLCVLGFAAVLAGCAGVPRGSPPTLVAPAPGDGGGDLATLDSMPPAPALPALPPPPATEVRRVDVADEETRRSLWDRIRDAYELAPIDDELVGKWEQWYAGRPDYVERMTTRSARYLFYIVEEIERRGLPVDLALLPFVESAFNPQALSAARAAGIWQFTPGTGRNFELLQSVFGDERHGVLASTRAALDYLERLYALKSPKHPLFRRLNSRQMKLSPHLQSAPLERAVGRKALTLT